MRRTISIFFYILYVAAFAGLDLVPTSGRVGKDYMAILTVGCPVMVAYLLRPHKSIAQHVMFWAGLFMILMSRYWILITGFVTGANLSLRLIGGILMLGLVENYLKEKRKDI